MAQESGCHTLAALFEKSVAQHFMRPFLGTKKNGSWTWRHYGEVSFLVEMMVTRLDWMGVTHGDRVGIIANNRLEWVVCAFACYAIGAVVVPMYESQPEKDWNYIIDDCKPKVLFVANEAIRDKILGGEAGRPTLRWVVNFDGGSTEYVRPATDTRLSVPLSPSYAALMDAQGFNAAPASLVPAAISSAHRKILSTDIACLIYTSGTTGNPKGVMLSHGNITSNIEAVRNLGIVNAQDRSLSFLPWAHVFGHTAELQGMMSVGGSLAMCESVESLISHLSEVSPTVLFAVPAIFSKIHIRVRAQVAAKSKLVQALFRKALEAAQQRRETGSAGIIGAIILFLAGKLIFAKARQRFGGKLRMAICGGAALPREVGEFVDTLGIPVYEGYGMTETSPIVTVNYPGNRKLGTGGKVIKGVTVLIDKSVGNDNLNGEICVRGPNIMQGYYNQPEETAKSLSCCGELRTGDMGHLDAEGFLHITGRINEQYKLENGKFVAPSPLEDDLRGSPLVKNVMVYGLNRPYNVALIVVDVEAIRQHFTATVGHTPTYPPEMLVSEGHVVIAYREALDKHSAGWKSYEKVKRFALIIDDFTQENGMLTPTMKLKRRNVVAAHTERIEKLYVSDSLCSEKRR